MQRYACSPPQPCVDMDCNVLHSEKIRLAGDTAPVIYLACNNLSGQEGCMPQHDELRHDTGTIAKIDFSYDDNDDPFNTTRFNGLGKKYDVSNSVDAKCGEGGFKPELSKTWPHVKVLVENTGDCEVTVTLAEGITKNFPTYTGNTNVKATFKVGKKEPGKDPHNNNAQTDGVNMIIFECSESDPDDFGNECKFEYKIRAY